MRPAFSIIPLSQVNPASVEALLDAAFGPDRFGRTAYRIRTGMDAIAELSFALVDDDGDLVGTLQSWPVSLDGTHSLAMIGPVAVLPERQGDGHGRALMDAVMDAATAIGAPPLVMIGDPEYYGRFWSFSAHETQGWAVPGPVDRRRLLLNRLHRDPLPLIGTLGPRVEIAVLQPG